ncbi:CBS domain-containing protein [Eilatimonas milleporae]|uniref:CBS domain protein n=1 Tax=Eilatimonas milleporae TaxID=911205 RepID=A0A3M0CX98_9PROT|nr:CBS domain-containing protein [Eilatimonas milleporae]RMB12149.1 CBS domain protein [Eilatimonas milleporae]
MSVATILGGGKGPVHTISTQASVREAVAGLARHNVGALVVSDDGRTIDGILSERDIVRALHEKGDGALAGTVAGLMVTGVITCSCDDTIQQVMSVMTENRIRHLPVLDDGALVGIVSIGDIVKNRLEDVQAEADAMRAYIAQA